MKLFDLDPSIFETFEEQSKPSVKPGLNHSILFRTRFVAKLRTLDIFAGCGGLSEGIHQSEIAETQWAIEYDEAAANAFRKNHPNCRVFCQNVSTLLYRIMSHHGRAGECSACEEVQKISKSIPDDVISSMPRPGEVDFMVGGPPCQGFSGMNRFNKGKWSTVQNSMVLFAKSVRFEILFRS